jgi:hypothetical protein
MAARARNWNDKVAERRRIGKRVASATTSVALEDKQARERALIESRIAAALAAARDNGAREAIARRAEEARMALAERHRRQAEKAQVAARTNAGAGAKASYPQSELARRHEKEIAAAEKAYRARREAAFAADTWYARGAEKNALSHRLKTEWDAEQAGMRARHDREIARLAEAERRIEAKRQAPEDAFAAYHAAVRADRYRVTARLGSKAAVMGPRDAQGVAIGWTTEEVLGGMTEVKRADSRGENIYLTPLAAGWHYLVVDDMTA